MTGRQCQRHEHQATPQSVVAIHHYPKHVISAKDLGKRIIRQSGNFNATTYLRQRLSAAIQCGNALSVIGTCNSLPLCLFSFWFFFLFVGCSCISLSEEVSHVFNIVDFMLYLSLITSGVISGGFVSLFGAWSIADTLVEINENKNIYNSTEIGSTTHKFSQSQ